MGTMAMVSLYSIPTGCKVDGRHGQYVTDRLADLAESYGWEPEDWRDDPRAVRLSIEVGSWGEPALSTLREFHHLAGDNLIDWLNDVTDDDHLWHFEDGEVFLSARADLEAGVMDAPWVQKSPITGAYIVSAVVNGHLMTRTYYGYTRREVLSMFRQEARSSQ